MAFVYAASAFAVNVTKVIQGDNPSTETSSLIHERKSKRIREGRYCCQRYTRWIAAAEEMVHKDEAAEGS